MKSSEKDINRLVLAAVLIIASAAVLITGGLIADKKSVDMPAVEIIEAEDKAVTAEDNLAETVNTDDTIYSERRGIGGSCGGYICKHCYCRRAGVGTY